MSESSATESGRLTITLPQDVLNRLQIEVASGEFASDEEAVESILIERDAYQLAQQEDSHLEDWLEAEAPRLVAKFKSGQMQAAPVDQVFDRLSQRILARRSGQ